MLFLDRFMLSDIDIPYQFANCTYFHYPHDLKYKDCSLPLDMSSCNALKWVHLAKNFRTYFLAIIPFIISIFAIIINLYLLYCLINYWKKCSSDKRGEYASGKKKQLIFLINKTVSSIVALITFYVVLLVWKFGSLQYSSASLFIIVGSLSFITLIGFYFATTLLLYLAIVKPVYYKTAVTTRKCYAIVGVIWFVGLSFSILIGILGATLFYHDTAPISCQFTSCQDPTAILLTVFVGVLYIFVILEYIIMLNKMHKHTRGNKRLLKIIQNESSSISKKGGIVKKNEVSNDMDKEQRKPSSSSISHNIRAMNRLSINLCVFALSKLPFLILAIVTTVNLYHLSSLGEFTKTPCKTFHFGKIYFEVEALASSAAIIWIIGMIGDPIVVLLTDKTLKKQLKKHLNYLKFKNFEWEPLPCLTNKLDTFISIAIVALSLLKIARLISFLFMSQEISTKQLSVVSNSLKAKIFQSLRRQDCNTFLRILNNVVEKVSPQAMAQFFSLEYELLKTISNLSYEQLQLLMSMFDVNSDFVSLSYLNSINNFIKSDEISRMLKQFVERNLVTCVNDYDINLVDIFQMLSFQQLSAITEKYCKARETSTREKMLQELMEKADEDKNTPWSLENDIRQYAIEALLGIYKLNPNVRKVILAVIVCHNPCSRKIGNNFIWNSDWIFGRAYFQNLSNILEIDNFFMDTSINNNRLSIVSFEESLKYAETIEIFKKVKLVDDINSEVFIDSFNYVRELFSIVSTYQYECCNAVNCGIKLWKSRIYHIIYSIFYVIAEKFIKANKFLEGRMLYTILTNKEYTKNWIGSMSRFLWCLNGFIHYMNSNDFTTFFSHSGIITIPLIESTTNENVNRMKALRNNKSKKCFKIEKIYLQLFKKYKIILNDEQSYYIILNNIYHFQTIEDAVLEKLMTLNPFTNGGFYKNNSIWKEILYLIFGELFLKPFIDLKILKKKVEIEGFLVENLPFVDFYGNNIIHIYNIFLYGTNFIKQEIVRKNMNYYWKVKKIDKTSAIFKNPHEFLNFLSATNVKGLLFLCSLQMIQPKELFPGFPDFVLWNTKTRQLNCYLVQKSGEKLSYEQIQAMKCINFLLNISSKCIFVEIM